MHLYTPYTLDAIDQEIIQRLSSNAKISNSALSASIGLSPAATLERVKKLEQRGVIKGYKAIIDVHLLGFPLDGFLLVKLKDKKNDVLKKFEQTISKLEGITAASRVMGDWDYVLKVKAKSMQDAESIVSVEIMALPFFDKMQFLWMTEVLKGG